MSGALSPAAVIPAQAAQYSGKRAVFERIFWIPACAGMTEQFPPKHTQP